MSPPDTPDPVVELEPDDVAAPWRALGWTDEALAALLGGPTVEEPLR